MSYKPPYGTIPKIDDTNKQIVTDDKGVATFKLNFTKLNLLETETSLYFAVFYMIGDSEFVLRSSVVAIKRDEENKWNFRSHYKMIKWLVLY